MSAKNIDRGITLRFTSLTILVVALSGCSYHVRSQLIPTSGGPSDVYTCMQLALGRAGYAIVGADRASGWLQAQKRIETWWDTKRAEIYVTVIPDESGQGSHVQLTENTYAEQDAAQLRSACAAG